jgi:hypothetical protein
MRTLLAALAAALSLVTAAQIASADDGPMSHAADAANIEAIRHLLMATFDRPDAPLTVDPVIVQGDDAIAGWQQDGNGGRALLRRADGTWAVWLCAGEEVLDPDFLASHGLSTDAATALAGTAREAEITLGAGTSTLLDSFDGVVLIAASGDAAAQGHGAHGQPAPAHGAHGAHGQAAHGD